MSAVDLDRWVLRGAALLGYGVKQKRDHKSIVKQRSILVPHPWLSHLNPKITRQTMLVSAATPQEVLNFVGQDCDRNYHFHDRVSGRVTTQSSARAPLLIYRGFQRHQGQHWP